jgi:hypothetical protein
MNIELDTTAMDTILAGLLMLQGAILLDEVTTEIRDIATGNATHPMPTPDEIDELCIRVEMTRDAGT